MIMWKIVGVSKVSVLYIYIDYNFYLLLLFFFFFLIFIKTWIRCLKNSGFSHEKKLRSIPLPIFWGGLGIYNMNYIRLLFSSLLITYCVGQFCPMFKLWARKGPAQYPV